MACRPPFVFGLPVSLRVSKKRLTELVLSHPRPLKVVILAAGQGTRMRSGLPKVLHPIAGKAMVRHVIAAAAALNSQKTVVVVGHGAPVVESALADLADAAGVSMEGVL